MAIAYDANSTSASGTGNLSWTHTPVGTPKGVIVFIPQDNNVADEVTGVIYGGVTMGRVSYQTKTAGTDTSIYTYFLGSGLPTGAQTIAISAAGGTYTRIGQAVTVTSDGNTAVQAFGGKNEFAVTAPGGTLALSGITCFVAYAFQSLVTAVSQIAPLAGWTSRREYDFGSSVGGFYTYDTIASSDVTYGATQSSADLSEIAIALADVSVAVGSFTCFSSW